MVRDYEGLASLAEVLLELNSRWKPLPWQIPFVRALFYEGYKDLGAQCGRGAGKTEVSSYCLWRWAMENPGSENYFIGPLAIQMKEIVWASGRIQNFGPSEWIESINNTECRITLKNGSFIKIEGSNNAEKLRGIKPKGLIIWDEGKDCDPQAIEAMDPNRARYNAPMIFIGTPPDRDGPFMTRMRQLESDPRSFFTRATSYDNTYNEKSWLDRKRDLLIQAGLEDVWRREYMAEFVQGGNRSVFPMVPRMPVRPLKEMWPKDSYKWVLYVGFDPASTSVFAVEFFLFNPFSKKVIPVGEIYESRPEYCTARKIRDAVNEKISEFNKLGIKAIEMVYDSSARWFKQELVEIDETWWLSPCDKSSGLQGEISCWRGVLSHGHFEWTDATPKLRWEMENYILDDKGRLPDKDDHAWQAGAYILKAMGFDFNERLEPKELPSERRYFTMEEDFGAESYTDLE